MNEISADAATAVEQAIDNLPVANATTTPEETVEDPNKYTVFVVNCKWSKNERRRLTKAEKNSTLPEVVTFDVPENVLNQANKPKNVFNNVIETFIYDTLSKKYGYELSYCQIYLPLEKKPEDAVEAK